MKKTLALSAVLVLGMLGAACPGETNTANNANNTTNKANNATTAMTPANVSTPMNTMPVNNAAVNKAVNDMKETTNKATNDVKDAVNKVENAVNKKP